jgi:ABC-type bacteriocin/lantibiotic exporter with double-glycine peptidase domain
MKIETFKKGWALLDAKEQKQAILVLSVVILSAMSSALMVGSIMPFLAILADPRRIHETNLLKWLYQVGQFQSEYDFLIAIGLISLGVIIFSNALQMLRTYFVIKFATLRINSIGTRLLRAYLSRPYVYFLDKNSGELGSDILVETRQMVELFYRPAAETIAAMLSAISIIALLTWINPQVSALVLALGGGIYIISFGFSKKTIEKYGELRADSNRLRSKVATEALGGVKEIKILGKENAYVDAFTGPSNRVAKAETVVTVTGTLPQYVMQVIAFGGMIVLTLFLIDQDSYTNNGTLSSLLPLLGVLAFGGQRLIPELAKIYQGITQLNYGISVVDRIYESLQNLPTAERQKNEQKNIPIHLKDTIELRDLSFQYPGAVAPSLSSLSVTIRAGERVGVIGGSGAGKTTLADIMLGLLTPTKGRLIVDGVSITEDNVRAWQKSVGYVQQNIFISDTNILSNIALGVPEKEIDRLRAIAAAKTAQLDDFITGSLKDGYETSIGEKGVRLSGGQRQRIGIARVLYNDADLIVFDEATSALDVITEKQVMESIDALPGSKTVLLIAHRLSTLAQCDRLIIIENGKISGFGTREELRSGNSHFTELEAASNVDILP